MLVSYETKIKQLMIVKVKNLEDNVRVITSSRVICDYVKSLALSN